MPSRDGGGRPRRPVELADALLTLIDDAELRGEMGTLNRAKVREFAPDRVVPHYVEIMQSILRGPDDQRESAA